VQKQSSGLPALPTESAAVEAQMRGDTTAFQGSSQLPPLETHSAGEKVAVLLQELQVALTEQEAAQVRRIAETSQRPADADAIM
jgi:hypothetical protein